MEYWSGKVAIVTGASSGVGAEIAETLVRAGIKVVGVARRVDKIRNLAANLKSQKGILYPLKGDVSKEEDILRVFEWTIKELGGVDIMINNAAFFISEPIIEGSTENFRQMMDVNVVGVAICIREAVRSMRARNARGHIININSISGHNAEMVMIPVSLYSASKYAITCITQAVMNELATAKVNHIKVTSISPGAIKTALMVLAGVPADMLDKLPFLSTKDVADAIVYALSTPEHVQVKEMIVSTVVPLASVLSG